MTSPGTQSQQPGSSANWSRNCFAFLSVLVVIVASVALSSCSGYTSQASTGGGGGSTGGGGQTGTPGTGVLTAGSSSLVFGNIAVGATSTQTVNVTNTGTATVNISQAAVTGTGFSVMSGSGAVSVPVGQSAAVEIQFAPTSPASDSGTLTVTSDASNASLAISLSGTGTEAMIAMSPTSLNFSNVPVGQTSSQNVTLTNNGNSNLVVTAATVSGTGFGMSGLALPKTIAGGGQSATFSVQFTPNSTSGATGSITFTDNAGNSPQMMTLTGSAVSTGSTLGANPGSVNFGNVVVNGNGSQSITLTNSGNATITINQVTTTGSGFGETGLSAGQTIAAGGTANFSATFTPTGTTPASGNISINSTATNGGLSIPLSGTGIQGALSANPASINFGNLPINTNSVVPVQLTNTGTASVSISSSSVSGTGFTMSTLSPQTLNPGGTASFNVTFAPTTATGASGSVSISSNAPGSPLTISLSGTGTQPQISATPSSVNFGTVSVGNNNSQTVTLHNNGNATLTFSQIAVAGTGFSQTGLSTSSTIGAGGSLNFSAIFTPTTGTPASGTITLTTNGTPSPLVINLSGTGSTPTLSLGTNPSSLPFGNVNDGSSSQLTTLLTNNGNSNITISSVTTTANSGFTASGVANNTVLTPSQSVTLTVTFSPTNPGAVNGATVTINSNATNSPTTITLSGTGTHTVLLSWDASTTSGVTYNVFRATSSGGFGASPLNSSPVSGTTFTDTNVTSGQQYFYVVTAVNSNGSSGDSNQANVTVPTP